MVMKRPKYKNHEKIQQIYNINLLNNYTWIILILVVYFRNETNVIFLLITIQTYI